MLEMKDNTIGCTQPANNPFATWTGVGDLRISSATRSACGGSSSCRGFNASATYFYGSGNRFPSSIATQPRQARHEPVEPSTAGGACLRLPSPPRS
jgi:hypothetical protein